jgi:anti-sigma B factor antagonist
MEDLGIGVHATDGSTVVVLRGEADLASRERLRAVLRVCRGEVVVDLSRATFLDAASIGVFVSEQHRLAAQDGRLRLVGPTGIVERVLHLVGLASWIDAAPAPPATRTRTLASLD